MDLTLFTNESPGDLVTITGGDADHGNWSHKAFIPHRLPPVLDLRAATWLAVANARAALAGLDSTASRLDHPQLFRRSSLRVEAQSTSQLEGTYAPLREVLTANEGSPASPELREVLNYVDMADYGFAMVEEGRPLGVPLLADLQGVLMRGTPKESMSGRLRDSQVVIGRRADATVDMFPVVAARFVPAPPGPQLEGSLADLFEWARTIRKDIDPVVGAALAHYQFETLHPFVDGNGRLGRYLIVWYLLQSGVLSEPSLTVSPWFEARRGQYYDHLLAISTRGDWDSFIRFFAEGLAASATQTRADILALLDIQAELHRIVAQSSLRADSAHKAVDVAITHPTFTVKGIQEATGVTHARASKLIAQLSDLGVFEVLNPEEYQRRYYAPKVLAMLMAQGRLADVG